MSTKTAPNSQKAILTFNVFFREDTTTQSFLPSIVSKDPCHWAVFRSVFAGRKDCKLTIVDKSVETPFHCLLVSLFCKQLETELQATMEAHYADSVTAAQGASWWYQHDQHAVRHDNASK